MEGNFGLELLPLDVYAKNQSNFRTQEEFMVHPVHGADPDKIAHRTYKTLEPAGEVAVVQRPEGNVKLLFYTCSGADRNCHSEITLDRDAAFNFALEILQHAYREGEEA
jgi:hypothetical protein